MSARLHELQRNLVDSVGDISCYYDEDEITLDEFYIDITNAAEDYKNVREVLNELLVEPFDSGLAHRMSKFMLTLEPDSDSE